MILGFHDVILPFEAECQQVRAELRQRLFHQAASHVPRCVRHEFTTTEPNKKRVVFGDDLVSPRACGSRCQQPPGDGQKVLVFAGWRCREQCKDRVIGGCAQEAPEQPVGIGTQLVIRLDSNDAGIGIIGHIACRRCGHSSRFCVSP